MDFDTLVAERRSFRSYEVSDAMTRQEVEKLVQTTLQAPSWKNSETGRYYFAITEDAVRQVRETLPVFNQNSSRNACAYVVTAFVRNISGHTNGQPDNELGNGWGSYDLGLQNSYLILKAKEMGYDSLIMGLRDAQRLREVLHIPEDQEVAAVIALGKGSGEPAIRTRKAVQEVCSIF